MKNIEKIGSKTHLGRPCPRCEDRPSRKNWPALRLTTGWRQYREFFFLRSNWPLGNVFCGKRSFFEHSIFRYLLVNQ